VNLRNLTRTIVLIGLAAMLCGFKHFEPAYGLSPQVYRGEPVRDAVATLGRPVRTAHTDGQRILYWRVIRFDGRSLCKIWGAARHNIIVNWGYEECAF
jgi:hypothetical protein